MNLPQKIRHVAIYTRISQDKDLDKKAVDRQLIECQALVKQLRTAGRLSADIRVVPYCDNDTSAFQKKPREKYQEMLAEAGRGKVEAIIAFHTDRLYRRIPDLYAIAQLVDAHPHLTVHTVKAGLVDFSTPAGEFVATLLASVAQYEVKLKTDRQRSQSDQIAKTGEPRRGGTRPFGYMLDKAGKDGRYVKVCEAEAALIRSAAVTLRNEGSRATYGLISAWNKSGIKTTRGNVWRENSFVAVMTRWRNAGLREHRGEVVGKASWPAILNETQLNDLRDLLLTPGQDTGVDRTRKHLLSFILRCDRCGTKLRAGAAFSRKKRYAVYQCQGVLSDGASCRLAIKQEVAERAVQTYVISRLMMPDVSLLSVGVDERRRLAAIELRRAEIERDEQRATKSKISMASRIRMLEPLNEERQELAEEERQIRSQLVLASILTDTSGAYLTRGLVRWSEAQEARKLVTDQFRKLSLADKRQIIRALCGVTILKAQLGVSYKGGRSYERIVIQPRNAATGELEGESLSGSDVAGPPKQKSAIKPAYGDLSVLEELDFHG